MIHVLALSLKWEPELHGIVVLALAVILLPGSIYLLHATNLVWRVGFLIAVAGLTGWMAVMGVVWTIYGIGLKGNAAVWKVKEVVAGDVAASPNPALDGFPKGWKKQKLDDPATAEGAAAADPALAPPAASGKQGLYTGSSDYIVIGADDKGGERYFPGWNHPPDFLAIKHKPHFLAVQVQKAVKQTTQPGQAPPRPRADPSAPVTTVVLERDLGSLRQPAAVFTFASLILFAVSSYVLHYRDKEAWAKRGMEMEPVGRGPG